MNGLSVMYFTCDTNKKNQESKGDLITIILVNIIKSKILQLCNLKFWYVYCRGFPGGSVVENLPANAGDMASISGSGGTSREGNGNRLVFLPEKSHGQSSLAGYSLWGHK